MVFPSIRCLTCKNRRVKCDASRPRCERCRKGNRDCFWEDNGASHTDALFRNENAFARGWPRRPRRSMGLAAKPASDELQAHNTPTLNLQRVDFPIEVYAFHYWIENLATWANDLFEIGQEYGAGARYHLHSTQETETSLHLAVSAFSLAIFGRANNAYEVLQRAEKFYARGISKLRRELKVLSNDMIEKLLLATMMLSKYDNIMYGFRVRRSSTTLPSARGTSLPLLGSFAYHYKGTASLLQVRQQRGYIQNAPLEKALRRTIIRAHLFSGEPVPAWLHEGTYGEPDQALSLDCLMIKVASLRSKSSIIVNSANLGAIPHKETLRGLLTEAQLLDRLFLKWAEDIPQAWRFITHKKLKYDNDRLAVGSHHLFYDEYFHSYTSHGHAVVWNRYRAVRVLVNSIQMELLSLLSRYIPENSGTVTLEQATACHRIMNSLTTDLCRSIPFFYLSKSKIAPGLPHNVRVLELPTADSLDFMSPQFSPIMMSVLLAWPIAVALRVGGMASDQMEWLRCRLQAVSLVIGAPGIHITSEN